MKLTPRLLGNALLFSALMALIIVSVKGYILHKQIPQETVIIKKDSIVPDTTKFTKFDDSIR